MKITGMKIGLCVAMVMVVGFGTLAQGAPLINTYTGGTVDSVFHLFYTGGTSNITATASESLGSLGATVTVNGEGLRTTGPFVGSPTFADELGGNGIPEQSNGFGGWLSKGGPGNGGAAVNRLWLSYNLPGTYSLEKLRLWNYFQPGGFSARGVQTAYIWVSTVASPSITATTGGASPGSDWTMFGSGTVTFVKSPDSGFDDDTVTNLALNGTIARHLLIDVETTFPGADSYTGVGEVQFFGSPYVQAVPEPATLALVVMGLVGMSIRRKA